MWIHTTKNFVSVSRKRCQREAVLTETFKRSGVDVLPLSTEEDLIRAIIRFAAIRRQHRK